MYRGPGRNTKENLTQRLKTFMGEVTPKQLFSSAAPCSVFSHPSLSVNVKRQPWGAQTQTMCL